jgi:hypothetical protein
MRRDHERAEQIETLLMAQFDWWEAPEAMAKGSDRASLCGDCVQLYEASGSDRTPT